VTPGQIARRLLGPAFQPIGEAYRRIFVDAEKVAAWIAQHLPANGRLLDVGGGDGYIVNLLLKRRADITATMTDIAPQVGGFIESAYRDRVTIHTSTPASRVEGAFDAITLTDVLHHVPVEARGGFFAEISDLAHRTSSGVILVKDIEPGALRSKLSLWSDWYVTGDRHVRLIAAEEIRFPRFTRTETAMIDFPNYGAVFRPEG
jgi:hypothetical protein